jgi:hypothetical protein
MDNQYLFIFLNSVGLFGFGAGVVNTFMTLTFLDVSKLVLDFYFAPYSIVSQILKYAESRLRIYLADKWRRFYFAWRASELAYQYREPHAWRH